MIGLSRRSFVVCVAVLCTAAAAFAQERPGSVYVIGGIVQTYQDGPSGESSQTYVTAPGGRTGGWLVGGGVFVARALSIEAEFSTTGMMEAREPSRYGMTFTEERRDRFWSLALRLHLPRGARFRVEPVVGVVVTRPEAWSQTTTYRSWLTPQQTLEVGPHQQHRLASAAGLTVGCDIRIGGRRVAVLPHVRASATGVTHGFYGGSSDRKDIGSIYPGGYPTWTIRVGAAIRVGF